MNHHAFRDMARAVLEAESRAILDLLPRLNEDFDRACHLMLGCEGRIIVIGMGKSGHIGGKIASTLASTGSPAFFVHPGEAAHGDFGMITAADVVLAISNSGETDEILTLLPLLTRLSIPLIAFTGRPASTLAKAASVHIDTSVDEEACPLNLAPTSSTTATLAMGDALAVSLLEARGFTAQDFALSHPAGTLGRRLLLRVSDVMHKGDQIPIVAQGASFREALEEMTRKGLGMTAVVDGDNKLVGIFTDGDLRRSLDAGVDVHGSCIADYMTPGGKTIEADLLAEEAVKRLEHDKISGLMVVDESQRLVGALNMHDLLRAGVV